MNSKTLPPALPALRFSLCLLALLVGAAFGQRAPTDPAPAPAAPVIPVATSTAPVRASDEIVTLSPFEVVSDAKGYFASNTMSGTRFNTKLEDLATPLTIVTKEQMLDFAMLDLNDVFLYTANTEGTGTYSDFVMNRNGELTDNVSLNPTQANRVRGIASANISFGNFETMGRTPLDPISLDAVEVSRGPNANVFGLGNPSGTVNQVPASANTSRHRTRSEFRVDSYEGYRAALDVNRVLLKDKLAVRVSGVQAREGFERKPSGIYSQRYNGMVKFQPFRNTTISGALFYYNSHGNRPNFTPPRDFASYWVRRGKAGWDPITQLVHVNGQTFGPFTTDAFIATPEFDYFNRAGGQFQRSNVFIDRTGFAYWTATAAVTGNTPTTGTGSGVNFIRLMGTSPGPNGTSGKFTDQPLFSSVPTVFDKSIYDYSSINLAAPNYTSERSHTYHLTIDQVFFNTRRQMLAGQLGFYREDSKRFRHVPVGDAGTGGQNGQLWVDVNERNLDGSVNPFFGRPYIGVNEPITSFFPAKWDTYRAQLIYRHDFTEDQRWTKWLGRHQISPYYEYKYRIQRKYSFREAIASTPEWLQAGVGGIVANFAPANQSNQPAPGPQAGPNVAREFFRFYLGDANGTNVDYAPGAIPNGTFPFVWGGLGNWRREQTKLARLATTDNTGGSNNLKTILKTEGGVTQSTFFGGKFVATFGLREDTSYQKFGVTPVFLTSGNTEHDFERMNHWAAGNYRIGSGRTKTQQYVARPFRDLRVVRGWAESGSGLTRFLGQLVQGSSIYFNQSDNFIPSPPAIDLFRNQLPNQTGKGKDYGLWLNLLDGRVVLRVNRYENSQLNARDGDANTIAQRILRLDGIIAADRYRLYQRATDWYTLTQPSWSAQQVETAVFTQMGLSREEFYTLQEAGNAGTLAATNDIIAKGTEIEINLNLTRHWTVSANAEEKQSLNANISSSIQRWADQRLAVWTKIVDPNTNPALGLGTVESTGWVNPANPQHLWWAHAYGGSQTPAQNYAVNVEAPWSIIRETEGKPRPQIRRYAFRISTSYQLSGLTEHRILRAMSVGGAVRWEDKAAIGYWGVEKYPATITRLDPNRPIWDGTHAYFDAFVTYRTKLFSDRVSATFRLNGRNLQEGGRLQAVGAFPNGEIHSARIIDPRQFIFSASFDL
ncbi:MAG: TonB-dependent receptor [Verrucomicrobia bacterium]|nr:TonB-dependent receptor [Verrucomicrobiota bacterium]